MADDSKNTIDPAKSESTAFKIPRHSEWRRITKVVFSRKLYAIGFGLVVFIILIAIFAPLITPYEPNKTDLYARLEGPSSEHWLGTDQLGRDILTRILYGAQVSLTVSIVAVLAGNAVGVIMGITAAYFGGIVFAIIMRITDALMAFPSILLFILIAGLASARGISAGGGIPVMIIALSFGGIAGMCRMMCGLALSVKQRDYILSARSIGMGDLRIMLTQIFPNAFPPLMVNITMGIGGMVMAEAGLSFLGIGVVPPTASWGSMIMDGIPYLLTHPILSIAPGIAIMMLMFGWNMFGDGLRDAVDPRLRGVF